MSTPLMHAIDSRSASALASGDLVPVQSEQIEMDDGGMRFRVLWVASLAAKDATAQVAIPGGPRDPNFNPFLNPDPALTVGPIGEHHTIILNKFPLTARHLVLARRVFAEQLEPLNLADFTALALVMTEAGGLGLYNGGTAAGASQRHKHLQWIPGTDEQANLRLYLPGLPQGAQPLEVARHPALPLQHCFVRIGEMQGAPVEQTATTLHQAFQVACSQLGLAPDTDGCLPACNLLVGDGWLLLIPRSQEMVEGISLSAICFGGALYLRQPEQMELVRREGPLKVLGAVGYPL
ncbi:ATP adenylyltransferase family protein [Brachymonas chironomi]|uniref:ATP adenylyltransferase family protein n=1 Tax=Brachymonas chironomi TaxID=491919 RepID=UPI000362D8C3|nr:hypothetical protein [Brachymonas chironomi]